MKRGEAGGKTEAGQTTSKEVRAMREEGRGKRDNRTVKSEEQRGKR